MTQKLYECDSYVQKFTAAVLSCTPIGQGFAVVLDRTAFFPEGGGQPCDLGVLGGARVLAVHTDGETVTHTTDAPLQAGQTVEGQIDWARRLDAMQQHTGEHILSGALHRMFGAENVGFHIGDPYVRMDTSIPLTAAQLAQAESAANEAVRADTPVKCWVPDAETLAATEYRSKKALEGDVRLVEAGGDVCACCGTHLARTGEVGLIKIISAQHYKTGMRLAVACGRRAYDAVAAAWADAEASGRKLSVAVGALEPAVDRLLQAEAAQKEKSAQLVMNIGAMICERVVPRTPVVDWIEGASADDLRRIAVDVSTFVLSNCCLFAAGGKGIVYAMTAHEGGDIRPACKALNEKFGGAGGGKATFCQGSLAVAPDDEDAFSDVVVFLRELWKVNR